MAARAGPALSPRAQRALLCSSAFAIDSPLPLSGRWQRSPENGRGRGGPGDPRRPSHPDQRPSRVGSWRAATAGLAARLFPASASPLPVRANCCFSLALGFSPILPSLSATLRFGLRVFAVPALTLGPLRLPRDRTPSSSPADHSWVHTCPSTQPGGPFLLRVCVGYRTVPRP